MEPCTGISESLYDGSGNWDLPAGVREEVDGYGYNATRAGRAGRYTRAARDPDDQPKGQSLAPLRSAGTLSGKSARARVVAGVESGQTAST